MKTYAIDAENSITALGSQQADFEGEIFATQQELADLVGASRPAVSTILNRLRARGVLGYSREYVCVRRIDDITSLIDS